MPAQILGHRGRIDVASVRLLGERLERDGVQIAAQCALQRSYAHPSRLGRRLFDPLARSALRRDRTPAEQAQTRGRLQLVRSRAAEQLVEQHTQRVDIAAYID